MGMIDAQQLEDNEQYEKAYEEYKKVYERKSNLEVLERLAHVALILDKKEEALKYYNEILSLDATNVLAYEQLMDLYIHSDKYKYYISRGNLHVLQKELSHAINDFKKALAKAQTDEEINATRFVLASLYEQTGKNNNAIDEYLRILDTEASNEHVYLNLASIYIKENSVSSAIETLERAIKDGYDSKNIRETLAQLYLKNNDTKKVREISTDELTKAKSLLDEGENEKAFEILEKEKENNKKNPKYYSILAQYYFNKGNWEESLQAVEEFNKFQKNSPIYYQMRALIFEEQNKDFDAHINWAKYNLLRGNKDVALNDYYSAYRINEDDADLIRNLAELLEDMGDKTQAGEFWLNLIRLDNKDKRALSKAAEFKESIGAYREEAEILEQWYELDNRNALLLKKLAISCEKSKNKQKALEYYNKFVQVSPVNEDYEKAKIKIQTLSSNSEPTEESEGLLDKIMKLFAK